MNDMDDRLRDLLQRRASDVPPHLEVPPSLVGRARRRIAFDALGVGVTLAVVAAGVLAGLRAFGGPSPHETGATTTACSSAQLRAVGTLLGAAGSREGAITLTNLSDATCTVQGTPAITLLDQNLDPITSGVTFGRSPAGWVVDGSPRPAGWPVVTLAPQDPASVRVRWSNWCPDGRAAPLWRVEIPGGGTVDVNGMDSVAPPPCNGPGQPSTIEVGPFEPGAAP